MGIAIGAIWSALSYFVVSKLADACVGIVGRVLVALGLGTVSVRLLPVTCLWSGSSIVLPAACVTCSSCSKGLNVSVLRSALSRSRLTQVRR